MPDFSNQELRAGTTLYLLVPAILFAAGWLRAPVAMVSVALLAGCAWLAIRDIYQAWQVGRQTRHAAPRRAWVWMLPGLALLGTWLVLSGVGGIGYQNADHNARNSLLKALILEPWPLSLTLNGARTPLIYYAGFYLLAAGIGKALGWLAANFLLFGWTVLGVGLAFRWFHLASRVELRGSFGRLVWLVLVFCLAGGLDYWAVYLGEGHAPEMTRHVEHWATLVQFSSQTTLMYWAPQHAVAGWLLTGLVVDAFANPSDPRYLPVSLAAGIIWSPFSVLGLLPFLLLVALNYLRSAALMRWRVPGTWLALATALWVGTIHGLYLISSRFQFPIQWIWESEPNPIRLALLLTLFWLMEFGFLTIAVFVYILAARYRWPRGGLAPWQAWLGLVSLGVLLALSLVQLGLYNDLTMRASLPALFIGWACVARITLTSRADPAPPRLRLGHALARLLVLAVVVAGFLPALTEILRSVSRYRFGPPDWSAVVTMETVNNADMVQQMAGDPTSLFFRYLGR